MERDFQKRANRNKEGESSMHSREIKGGEMSWRFETWTKVVVLAGMEPDAIICELNSREQRGRERV